MSLFQSVKNHIDRMPGGAVFSGVDLVHFAKKGNIDVILHRLSQSGHIRKLNYGLYDKPLVSQILGYLSPNVKNIMKAYARKTGNKYVLDPMGAANHLSLTTQVPAQIRFLTNGTSQILNICGIKIYVTHASPKILAGLDSKAGLINQALRYYQNQPIPMDAIVKICNVMSNKDLRKLKDLKGKTLQYIDHQIDRIISHASIH